MATEIVQGPLGESRAMSTAGGGTALTTTAVRIAIDRGVKNLGLIPRNFAGATVVQWLTCPWLTILKTTDAHLTFTDYSLEAQDNSVATSITLSSLDTLANGDALYVGSHIPFAGVHVDVDAANGNASVLTVDYWNGTAWTDISATDGSASGGATFAVDGSITWTVPTAWSTARLVAAVPATGNHEGLGGELFWTRFSVSAALDASTTLDHMLALPRNTTYSELIESIGREFAVTIGPNGISAIQAKTDAGTANLIVNGDSRTGKRLYA